MMDLRDVEPGRRAGVALDAITTARRLHQREQRRPRALSATEALLAVEFEALLVAVEAARLASGQEISEADRERLAIASERIHCIVGEVVR